MSCIGPGLLQATADGISHGLTGGSSTAAGVCIPLSPAFCDGSASQAKALANSRSQSLGLSPAPAVSIASAVGQL